MLKTILIAALAAFICVIAPPAFAAMLNYVDKDGGKHFVDEYEKVPPEYRSQLKGQITVEDETAPRKASRPPEWLPSPDAQTTHVDTGKSDTVEPSAQEGNPTAAASSEKPNTGGFLNRLADFTENSTIGYVVKILAAITLLILFLGVGARICSNLGGKKLGTLILISITLGVLFYLANMHLRKIDATFKTVKDQIREIEKKLTGRGAEATAIMKETQKMDGHALQENIAAHHAAQQELTKQEAVPARQP